MGWMVLYIAFGFVGLWLLSEVLLQHKARLRWRLLAFTGFLGVVAGVIIPSVIVIAVGAVAFAVGQVKVTLSFRRGFTTGWALRRKRTESRRRRARSGGAKAPAAEPALQVSGVEAVPLPDGTGHGTDEQGTFAQRDTPQDHGATEGQADFPGQHGLDQEPYQGPGPYGAHHGYQGQGPYQDQDPYQDRSVFVPQNYPDQDGYPRPDATAVYAPQPLPDETGQYGVYSADARPPQTGHPGYDAYGNATGGSDGSGNGPAYGGSYGAPAGEQDPYAGQYGTYGDGQGGQQPYADPYLGAQQYPAPYDPYAQPDPYGRPPYVPEQYDGRPADGTGQSQGQQPGQGYVETPPGGVWVPQQRDAEPPAGQPPYPPHQQQGYDEQHYRY
ncbi:hypothetical protein ACWIG3_17950 [Streptomyces celluloflavus]